MNTKYSERTVEKLSAYLSSEVLELGEEQTVYVEARDLDGEAWVGIIAENEHKKYLVDSGDFTNSFAFTPGKLGENSVIVYTSEGETLTLDYLVESNISIAVEDFSVPSYLKIGERKNISARIANKGKTEENGQILHHNLRGLVSYILVSDQTH